MTGAFPFRVGNRLTLCGLLAASLVFVVLVKASAEEGAKAAQAGLTPLAAFTWKDITGKRYDTTQLEKRKATVFLFLSTQCPISNTYTPRINELARKYTPQGVQFFLVNSNREDSAETVRRDAKARKFVSPVVKDNGTALADWLTADRTPEAIVVDDRAVVRYRGRIDDNPDREKVIRHDLSEALDALLTGQPIARARTLPLGCYIFRDTPQPASGAKLALTYARDVAPILGANCVGCHRPGEAAPFALETYPQARTWARAIKDYTARHIMPPWKAAPGYGDFHDARTLTNNQIQTLARWADAGAPLGNLKDLKPLPKYVTPSGWALGKPDIVSEPEGTYKIGAEGKDIYREYVLPVTTEEDKYINAIEFKPGNRAIVHHIIVFFDLSGKSVELDKADPEPGYTVPGAGIGVPMEQSIWVAGWAPGNTPRFLPQGAAFKLPKGAKVVLQVHYHKDGKDETDRSQVAFYLTDKKSVDKEIQTAAILRYHLPLTPGDSHIEIRQGFDLNWPGIEGVHVWAVMPHMHMLGREMKLTATLPNGTKKEMIYIPDWDFNWQETYRYKEPLVLPKGSHIDLLAVFDNSERNPRQTSHPPKQVGWGEQTTDEMCIGFFQYSVDLPKSGKQPGDKTAKSVVTDSKTR